MSNPAPSIADIEALAARLTSTIPSEIETINSVYNPERLGNNCFFVTLAHLCGTNARDLCNRLGQRPGPTGVGLVTANHALALLGVRFDIWVYTPTSGGGPDPQERRGVPETTAMRTPGLPRAVGVAYRRPDGSGHVVVCRAPGRPYRRYVDYQLRTEGQDVTAEVRNSRILMVFAVDRQNSTGGFIQQQQPQIEQMEVDEDQAAQAAEEPMEVDNGPGNSSGFWGGRFHDEL